MSDKYKHFMVCKAVFSHCSSISEFNSLLKKALRSYSTSIKAQNGTSFSLKNITNFVTDGEQNMRIDLDKKGATLEMTLIVESINESDLIKNEETINLIFDKVKETFESAPFPMDNKTGKVRRVKLTLESVEQPFENKYEIGATNGNNLFEEHDKKNIIVSICIAIIGIAIYAFISLYDFSDSSNQESYQTNTQSAADAQREQRELEAYQAKAQVAFDIFCGTYCSNAEMVRGGSGYGFLQVAFYKDKTYILRVTDAYYHDILSQSSGIFTFMPDVGAVLTNSSGEQEATVTIEGNNTIKMGAYTLHRQ